MMISMGAIAIAAAVALLLLVKPADAGCTNADIVLEAMNGMRSGLNAPPLAWDTALNTSAQARADAWKSTFDGFCAPPPPVDGVNTGVFANGEGMMCTIMIGTSRPSWLESPYMRWNLTSTPYTDNRQWVSSYQAWIQIMWAASTKVGCGSATAAGGCTLFVCEFGPTSIVRTDAAFKANIKALSSDLFNNNNTDDTSTPALGCVGVEGVMADQNVRRVDHQVTPLTWNLTLVASAKARATSLAATATDCQWGDWPVLPGENLWSKVSFSKSEVAQCSLANEYWIDESNYSYESTTPYTDLVEQGLYDSVKYFTQSVWKATSSMGCATSVGYTQTEVDEAACFFLVCHYNTPGNMPLTDAAFVANVLPSIGNEPEPEPEPGCHNLTELVSSINLIRAMHYSLPLAWNNTLATAAQTRANAVLSTHGTECSILENATLPAGENVFVYPTSYASCDVAGGWWTLGETAYNFSTTTPWDDNKNRFYEWRAFAQVVWSNSSSVGCARANSSTCQVVTCIFSPQGLQETNKALQDNVQRFLDPGTYNFTAVNSSVCSGMGLLPVSLNLIRLGHATRPLTWNESLVPSAQSRAKVVAASSPTCTLEGSNITLLPGESVYLEPWTTIPGFSFQPPCVLGYADWIAQESLYNYTNPNMTAISTFGSFTQMVWYNSTQVGCEAHIHTPPGVLGTQCLALVCKYAPAGNTPETASNFVYNVRPTVFSGDLSSVESPEQLLARRLMRQEAL